MTISDVDEPAQAGPTEWAGAPADLGDQGANDPGANDPGALGLGGLTDDELRRLARDARELSAGSGLAELFEAIVSEAAIERRGRAAGGEPDIDVELPERLGRDPLDVVLDQRDAMARAVQLRDDPDRSDGERAVWSIVVERLAELRRSAKEELADRRRRDPSEETRTEAELQRSVLARREATAERDAAVAGTPAAGDDGQHR